MGGEEHLTRLQALFGTPERAQATLASMECTGEDFEDCTECAFFAEMGAPCPQYRPQDLAEWLAGEWSG